MLQQLDQNVLSSYSSKKLDDMKLHEIARIIASNWKKTAKGGIYFGAAPYLEAMSCLDSVDDMYICDSGRTIVIYFLANAQTWRGPVAKEIKAHLNKLIKG